MPSRHAGSDHAAITDRVKVLLPLPLTGAFDYIAGAGRPLGAGDFVRVPLGRRQLVGVVWDPPEDGGGSAGEGDAGAKGAKTYALKTVTGLIEAPPLLDLQRRFIRWVAAYTLTPPGAVLRMVMSVPDALEPPKPVTAFAREPGWDAPGGFRMTPARKRVLAVLADGPPRPMDEIVREAGAGSSVVRGLQRAGALRPVHLPPPPPFAAPDWRRAGPKLSPSQAEAAAGLRAAVEKASGDGVDEGAKDGFSVSLLDGVTGSGKTEVYFEAIAKALEMEQNVLVLLPEIALSAQWLDRFESRFGAPPAQWHSELGAKARRTTWRAVAEGKVEVVVGARSALFLPFPDLGLIVVDEEHDPSFKQEEGVLYNARDMAVVRASLGAIPIVLVSATPSLETVTNAKGGRYAHLHLPDRHGGAIMPEVSLIDMRAEGPASGSWLSPTLKEALAGTLAAGEQAMLFLNRRGYAPLTLCRTCGHRLECPDCSAWLVEHRGIGRLACHHCGHSVVLPRCCPSCEDEGAWAACGPGVERLAEEAQALFPGARQAIMASDTLTGPEAAARLVRKVEGHEIDLLIGTQVMAKGHHFPLLTLVGVIDADLGLAGGDLRASERTYQLLAQVAGRAGRAERPGRVLLQTYEPDHPVMRALVSGGRDDFLDAEAEARRASAMPPFGRLAAIILSARDEAEVDRVARELSRRAPGGPEITVLGPAPAPLALLRGRHRRRFLIKAAKGFNIQGALRAWLDAATPPKSVRIQVDIDPYSFM
ncbi:MAG: primosomal protein N' [Alphaproteobacteria bacterium]